MWTMAGPHNRCPLNLAFSAPSRGRALHLITRRANGLPPPSGLWSLEAWVAVLPQGRPPHPPPRGGQRPLTSSAFSLAQPINTRLVGYRLPIGCGSGTAHRTWRWRPAGRRWLPARD